MPGQAAMDPTGAVIGYHIPKVLEGIGSIYDVVDDIANKGEITEYTTDRLKRRFKQSGLIPGLKSIPNAVRLGGIIPEEK